MTWFRLRGCTRRSEGSNAGPRPCRPLRLHIPRRCHSHRLHTSRPCRPLCLRTSRLFSPHRIHTSRLCSSRRLHTLQPFHTPPAVDPLSPARERDRVRGAFRQLRDARHQNPFPAPQAANEEEGLSITRARTTTRHRPTPLIPTGWAPLRHRPLPANRHSGRPWPGLSTPLNAETGLGRN